MREVPLTQGKVALVDDEDYERISKYKYYAVRTNINTYYAWRKYHQCHAKSSEPMAWDIIGRPKPGLEVHHKDGNPLNNTRDNLEFVTHKENMQAECVKHPGIYRHPRAVVSNRKRSSSQNRS